MDAKPGSQIKLSVKQRELLERRLMERSASGAKRTGIPRRAPAETTQLSFAQQRLWFLNILEPESSQYNLANALRIVGPLNYDALLRSLKLVVERHESLRTTIHRIDGSAYQKLNTDYVVECPTIDFADVAADERPAALKTWLAEVCSEPFDLSKDLMLRAGLCRLADEEHVLLLVLHHIASDAWSLDILLRDVGEAYAAFDSGKQPALAELPIQYPDFAVWQREWFSGPVLQKQLAYWRKQLEGAPPTLELPTDVPRHSVTSAKSAVLRIELPSGPTKCLDELSRREEGSLFMTLLAAFNLLLAKLTGRQDVVVRSPIAGRNREELENLIGFFVNTQVLRADLSGNPTFRNLVRRVRETTLEAYANQDLPFEKLVEELHPERSEHSTPLFQVFFNMLNMSEKQLELAGLDVEYYPRPETDSKFELTLYCRHRLDQLYFIAVYNAQLFSESRIKELLDQLMSLLTQVAANPDQPIDSYTLATERAAKILPDATASLSGKCGPPLHNLVSAQAGRTPDRVAVSDPHEKWTFGELESRSNQLANRLVAGGVGRGDVVAIYAHRSASLIPAMLATWKAGGAFLILDPAQPASRLIECMKIAKPVAWIELETTEPVTSPLSMFVDETIDVSRQIRIPKQFASNALLADQPKSAPAVKVEPHDNAYVAFTSGSTGAPKGILGSHGPLSHFFDWHVRTFGLNSEDRYSMLSGLGHDPLLRDIFTPLVTGATLVVPDSDDIGSDRLGQWMAKEQITVAHLTPAMSRVLAGSGERDSSVSSSTVRRLFFGGDRLTQRDIDRAQTWAPNATCVNFYGATETPQAIAWHEVRNSTDGASHSEAIPIGTGIDDVQLLVLNRAGKLCGIGEVGTIHVRTPHLADGYVNDPAQTSARFIANPFTSHADDRLYVTGDLGRYGLNGAVEFLGRDDDQVKIRGYRVELAEIESALRTHEHVGHALLTVSEGATGDRRLVAYVVPRNGQQPGARDLRIYLKERLPEFMVPSAYVVIDAIPLTPNGKVNRAALPAPESDKRDSESEQQGQGAPQSEFEQLIAGIWREFLHIDSITVYDNFLDLGGHSLLGMEVLSRVQKDAGVEIKPRELMFQTLGQIAALCDERKNAPADATREGLAGRMLRSFQVAVGLRREGK